MTAHRSREAGATLLSVLVIVMLMSVAAVAATDALARSVMIAKSSSARAETFWTARGAADAAGAYLSKATEGAGAQLNEDSTLLKAPVTLPAGHGLVVFSVGEASNCFNLNALVDDSGEASVGDAQLAAYQDLLVATDLNEAEAQSLAAKLADWIDADSSSRAYGAEDGYYASLAEPYRTPGRRLRNISELRAVAGYDADVLARVSGLVCLRPGISQPTLNLNTLTVDQAPLLSALFSPELSGAEARTLIDRRPTGGWESVEAFLQEPVVSSIAPTARHDTAVSVISSFFAADVDIGTGDLVTSYQALYGRAAGGEIELVSLVRRDF
jgi:general secretion pathway protein K